MAQGWEEVQGYGRMDIMVILTGAAEARRKEEVLTKDLGRLSAQPWGIVGGKRCL